MKIHTLSMTMSLALSIAACAAGEEDGVQPTTNIEVCEATGSPCLGDTICGQDHCEPAFNRVYKIGVRSMWFPSTRQLELCDQDPGCDLPRGMSVFFSDLADPILVAESVLPTSSAQIVVTEDSYLVVDLGDASCVVDLTAEALDSGKIGCATPSMRVSLSIDAM